MAIVQTIIEAIFSTDATLYSIQRRRTDGQVFNLSSGLFEIFNAANWSQYAVPLTEQTGTGYYWAARPSGVSGYLVSDTIYQQAGGGPATSDTAISLLLGAGDNLAAVAGDSYFSPTNLQAALSTETQGTVGTGTISAQSFPTSLTNSNSNAYQGMTLRFITGACAGMVGLIAQYNPSGGTISLSAGLPAMPVSGDQFIIC